MWTLVDKTDIKNKINPKYLLLLDLCGLYKLKREYIQPWSNK